MTSLTGSVASTQAICTRGVMISPAVRGPNATERCTRWAVSVSRVPSLADRLASEASSSEDARRAQLLLRLHAEHPHERRWPSR